VINVILFLVFCGLASVVIESCLVTAMLHMLVHPPVWHYALIGLAIGCSLDVSDACLIFDLSVDLCHVNRNNMLRKIC